MEELQTLVDTLAKNLGRSVAIDDPWLQLRSYSAHYDHVDQVRMTSIMTRAVPADVAAFAYAQGIKNAIKPVRLPGNAELDLDPRLCVPIRRQGELLGFLWLIDSDNSLQPADVDAATATAESAAEAMYRDRLLDDLRLGRERELVRDLLSESVEIREHAAANLVEADLLAPSSTYHAVVLRVANGSRSDPRVAETIEGALSEVRTKHSRRHVLPLGRPDHGLLVMAKGDPSLREGGPMRLGEEAQAIFQRMLDRDREGGRWWGG